MTDNTDQNDFNLDAMPDDGLKTLASKAMAELKKRAKKRDDEKPANEMSDEEFRAYADKRVGSKRG
jgi:hypothetical protein